MSVLATETTHLHETLALLEQRLTELGQLEPQGGSEHDSFSLYQRLRAVYDHLVAARAQIYFGRLDFAPEGKPAETHYLGRIGFEYRGQIVVVDWRAPFARLFSRRRPGRITYTSPDGPVNGDLLIKRHLQVQGATLIGLRDEYNTLAASDDGTLIDPDDYLRDLLSGRQSTALRDIVASLQEHQDDLIRAAPDQVLVVQGVAGSGKTSIALHRLAFLLYPGNQINFDAHRCILFGPNPLFLEYIANVLPGLGVRDIPQTTLETWALAQLNLSDIKLTDATLNTLFAPRASDADKATATRRSQLKGSLRFGRVLDRLIDERRARFAVPSQPLTYRGLGPLKIAVTLGPARLQTIYRSLMALPFAQHRLRFQEEILRELMGHYATTLNQRLHDLAADGEAALERSRQLVEEATRLEQYALFVAQNTTLTLEEQHTEESLQRGARGLRELAAHFQHEGERTKLRAARLREEEDADARRSDHHPELRAQVQAALAADLKDYWPEFDPLTAYRELLSDPPLIARLAENILPPAEQALLQPLAAKAKTLDVSDLPALCYLQVTTQGVTVPLYEHVVIDEAQDVAPLYLTLLRRFSRNQSFSLLGDLAQGVYAYRGVSDWEEVRAVFSDTSYNFYDVRESYRSTHEIVTLANRLLELIAPPHSTPRLAQPFERHGTSVQFTRLAQSAERLPALSQQTQAWQAADYRNVALLTKTEAAAQTLATDLQTAGFAAQLITPTARYAEGVVVLTVHLAKGLEFDAVIVVDADDKTYAASEFDGRLLYVAATRALHALCFVAVGRFNVHLELATSEQ